MATVRNVNEKKHKAEHDEGEKAPPPPMLISRTDHSITFAPAEYDLKKRVRFAYIELIFPHNLCFPVPYNFPFFR